MDDATRMKALLAHVTDRRLALRWAYYIGDHPRVYATPKLYELFRTLADSMVENYIALAINSRLSRLEVTGWTGDDADAAQAVWDASRLPQYQDRLYRYALVHSGAYLMADEREDGQQVLRLNPATLVYAEPDPDDPYTVGWGGKAWRGSDGWRITLYEPDRIARYLSPSDKQDALGDYVLEDEQPNTMARVPIVGVSPYGDGPALIDQISGVQDRINKIGANKFVAAEFGAFKQRVFFTTQDVQPYDVRQAPDHAIVLDPGESGEAKVQELTATDLANYDRAKDSEIDSLFTMATLPRHMRVNPGAPPSGEAIKADEGPFVEALRDHQRSMAEAMTDAMALFDIDAEPIWRDVEVHNEAVLATTVGTFVDAGIPWQTAVQKYAGWDEDEVADAQAAAQAPTGNAVGAALLNAFAAPTTPTA